MKKLLMAAGIAVVGLGLSPIAALAVPVAPNGEISLSQGNGSDPNNVDLGTLGAGTTSFTNIATNYTATFLSNVPPGVANLGVMNGDLVAISTSLLNTPSTVTPFTVQVTTATNVLTFTFNNLISWVYVAGANDAPGNIIVQYTGTFADQASDGGILDEFTDASASFIGNFQQLTVGGNIQNNFIIATPSTIETPEPATLALLGAGLVGLGAIRRRRQRA